MPLIPLEDNFTDVISKAQRGRKIPDEKLASMAGVSLEDLTAVKGGKPIIAVVRRIARHLRLNPDALETLTKRAWYPKTPIFQRGFSMFNTPMGEITVNSYLIWDSRTKEAAVIDTGADATDLIDFIKSEDLRLQYILLTHSHEDHVAGLPALAAAFPHAQVYCSEKEPIEHPGIRLFKEDVYFHIGTLSIKALHTPGHSPGLTSFFITGLSWPLVCCGDALFSCSVGGSEQHFDQQLSSDHAKLMTLPKDTVIAPGHGPLSTLAQEKEHNPFFAH